MTARAARLEHSGIVMQEKFFIFGLPDVRGFRHDAAEVVATLPQLKGPKGFICSKA